MERAQGRNVIIASCWQATRENQKKLYDERLQARQNVLEKRGIVPTEFKRDKVYEHLKAKHQAIVKAIAAIDASLKRQQHTEARDANTASRHRTSATADSSSTSLPFILALNTPALLDHILQVTFTNLTAARRSQSAPMTALNKELLVPDATSWRAVWLQYPNRRPWP